MEKTIKKCLLEIGIDPSILGFNYLAAAVELALESDQTLRATKDIYPVVAKRYKTTPSRTERAMRHAIERLFITIWNSNIVTASFLSNVIDPDKGKPTNTQFIYTMAEYIRLNEPTTALPAGFVEWATPEIKKLLERYMEERNGN